MMQRSTFLSLPIRSFLPNIRTTLTTWFAAAAFLTAALHAPAQAADATQGAAAASATTAAAPAATTQPNAIAVSNKKPAKTRKQKEDKVVESKDTRKDAKKTKKVDSLEGVDAKLPDKELYDKAEDAVKHGRYDVARLDLQTLLNTYPDSQYMMRAKLAIADSWYKEGGVAALTQAEQEYKDFITFFPNSPEAAEAQMRVGDIYFKQMDRPDRDDASTIHAEEAYRLMLQQFPDSPLVPQARQRLREVQETLAFREADIASFYASRQNWPATIARDQTVVDTYPLYSHMDDVLVGLGDAYEAEAHIVREMRLPEAGKARLEKIYDDQAYAAYSKVVLEHSAAAHVEDARDRIAAMGLPIPTPTAEQAAASAALENSRGQYTLSKRATVVILRQADTVPAATIGAPPLEDAKPTNAAMVMNQAIADLNNSMNPTAGDQRAAAPLTPDATAAPTDASKPAVAPAASAPLAFQDVPAGTGGGDSGSTAVVTNVPTTAPAAGGSSMGIEIVQPASGSESGSGSTAPVTAPATPPAFPGTVNPAQASDANGGLKAVGPPDATPLPPIEKAAAAPDAINEATPGSQPPAQTAPADGKKAKPAFDKSDESSSKHKKKKGLAKLNPF